MSSFPSNQLLIHLLQMGTLWMALLEISNVCMEPQKISITHLSYHENFFYGIVTRQHISPNIFLVCPSCAALFPHVSGPTTIITIATISPPCLFLPSLHLHTAAFSQLKSIRYGVWPLASQLLSIEVIAAHTSMKIMFDLAFQCLHRVLLIQAGRGV